MGYLEKRVKEIEMMKLVAKVYTTPGALKQMEDEMRSRSEKKSIFSRTKIEGPLDKKDVNAIMGNPKVASVVTSLCVENAIYEQALNAYETVMDHSGTPSVYFSYKVDEFQSLKKQKDDVIKSLADRRDISLDEFCDEKVPAMLSKASKRTIGIINETSKAMEALPEKRRASLEPVYDAPRISMLEEMKSDVNSYKEALKVGRSLKTGDFKDFKVSSRSSFAEFARMFSDFETMSAFQNVGEFFVATDPSKSPKLSSYKSPEEKAAVEEMEADIKDGETTFLKYSSILPAHISDKELKAGIQGFGEKIALTSLSNRANANVEYRRAIEAAQKGHAAEVESGKLTRVSSYGESVKTACDKIAKGKEGFTKRLLDIYVGEQAVERDINQRLSIIGHFSDLESIVAQYKKIEGAGKDEAGRAAAKALVDRRAGISVAEVMRGGTVTETTERVTAALGKDTKTKDELSTSKAERTTKKESEGR